MRGFPASPPRREAQLSSTPKDTRLPERAQPSHRSGCSYRFVVFGVDGLCVDQEGQLPLDGLVAALGDLPVEQAGGVVAGEVVVGELRLGGVARTRLHRPV